MNALLDPFKALWQRKLWPVAMLLVAALVAVPTLLAKEPTREPVPAFTAAADDEGLPATFVAAAEAPADGERRRVLGASKDPFRPAPLDKKTRAARKHAAAKEKAAEQQDNAPKADSTGPTAPAGSGAPPASAAPTPAPTYPRYSASVRFGQVEGELATKTVARLRELPSADQPLVIYRGVEDGGKIAVFELTGSVVALGDGKCEPTPEECQILKLRKGESESLTVSGTGGETDTQYQLDLVKIAVKRTAPKASLSKADAATLKSSERKPIYQFDPETGTLHKRK